MQSQLFVQYCPESAVLQAHTTGCSSDFIRYGITARNLLPVELVGTDFVTRCIAEYVYNLPQA